MENKRRVSPTNIKLVLIEEIGRDLFYKNKELDNVVSSLAYSDFNKIRDAQSLVAKYEKLGLTIIEDGRICLEYSQS